MKNFKDLTQTEQFAFANVNGLPTVPHKMPFVEREYEKACKRGEAGIIKDPIVLMRLKCERVPLLVENFQEA